MKRAVAGVVIVCVAAAFGCQDNNSKKTLTKAPPPKQQQQTERPQVFSLANHTSQVSANQAQTTKAPAAPQAKPKTIKTVQAQPAQPKVEHYTIRKGDTLWSIAKRTLGDGQKWQQIVAANPGLDPKLLRVGETIVIPR